MWKSLYIWQSYHRLCNVLFYRPQCSIQATIGADFKKTVGAQLLFILYLFFLVFLPSFPSLSLSFFIPTLSRAAAKRSEEAHKLSQRVRRSSATKRHLMHFGLKCASGERNFSAVYAIITSAAHKTKAFPCRNIAKRRQISMTAEHLHNFHHGCSSTSTHSVGAICQQP